MKLFKSLFFTLALTLFGIASIHAQRIAVVDINDVLESMDDYQIAQGELDRIAAQWRQEIAQEYDKIKSAYNKYQAEQVLLSEEARKQREDGIMEMEHQVREIQKDKFGAEGALFKKRQDLIRPIQERVYGTIESYADDRGYDFIFDKGGQGGLIFSSDEYDKTDDIKRRLKS